MTRYIPLFLVFLTLGACTQLPGPNRQGYAGINEAVVELADGVPTRVHITGGKESQEVNVAFSLPNGLSATYSARDVRAFDGQALRAEVERVLAETQGQAISDILPKLIDAIVKSIGVP